MRDKTEYVVQELIGDRIYMEDTLFLDKPDLAIKEAGKWWDSPIRQGDAVRVLSAGEIVYFIGQG